jgi:hypothetical protein
MTKRTLRLLHVIVQPVFVWDDGETLVPGPEVQPVQAPITALPDLPAQILAEIPRLTAAALEHPAAPPTAKP